MSRVIMKNGDVVDLESYDWKAYRSPVQLQAITRELRDKAESCKSEYPGQKVIFCFNANFGAVPPSVEHELLSLGIEIETWP
ncbi:MAG TPA: hypothetical protein VGF67_19495 [Ktedonobacteraceae bacterium]